MVRRSSRPEGKARMPALRKPTFRRGGTPAPGAPGRLQAMRGRLRQAADRVRQGALRGRGDRKR